MSPSPLDPELLLAQTGWLRRFAGTLVTDREAAEDLSQEAVLAALQRPPDSPGALRSWLRRVVQRRAAEQFRSQSARSRREQTVARSEVAESPTETLEKVEAQRAVVTALLDLQEIYRDTLALRFFEDLSYEQIAARCAVPEETVRTRIRRGLSLLRQRMDRRYGERRAWAAPLLGLEAPPPAARPMPLGPVLATLATLLVASLGYAALAPASPGAPVDLVVLRWPFRCALSDPAILVSKQVAAEFPDRVRVVQQDFGTSPLAAQHGLFAYPAVFLDGELIARPEDFYDWGGVEDGRFQPWQEPSNRARYAGLLREQIRTRLGAGGGAVPTRPVPAELPVEPRDPVDAPRQLAAPGSTVLARIDGVEEMLTARSTPPDDLVLEELDRLRARASAGKWSGALFALLEDPSVLVGGWDRPFVEWQRPPESAEGMSLAAFESGWEGLRTALRADYDSTRRTLAAVSADLPLPVRALAESNLHKVLPSLESARPYARATSVASAQPYIERARHLLHAVRLCTELRQVRAAEPSDPRGVTADLERLEREVLDRFAGLIAGSPREGDLLGVHAACKLAREMLARDRAAGAQLVLTEARITLAESDAVATPTLASLRRALAAARRLRGLDEDAWWQAFAQQVDLLLEGGSARDLLRAQAICDVVLFPDGGS